jgi:AraC family transcriptional regulator of adaptative response / DNA-3-methyladenine glycosylase II
VRAIIGQQVSVAAANTAAGRLVERLGTRVPGLEPLGLTHTFPSAAMLVGADYTGVGLMPARGTAIGSFARAVLEDRVRLDRSVTLDRLVASFSALDGLGPWTAHYIALRLGEPDAFPATDLGLQRAYTRIASHEPQPVGEAAESWRPWRALAAIHLWTASSQSEPSRRTKRSDGPVRRGPRAELAGTGPERRVALGADQVLRGQPPANVSSTR